MAAFIEDGAAPKIDDYAVGAWSAGFSYPTIMFFAERNLLGGTVVVLATIACMFVPWFESYFFRSRFHKLSVSGCLLLIGIVTVVFGSNYEGFWVSFSIYDIVLSDIVSGILGFFIIFLVSHSYAQSTSRSEVSERDHKS
jgi:hypothetical protein